MSAPNARGLTQAAYCREHQLNPDIPLGRCQVGIFQAAWQGAPLLRPACQKQRSPGGVKIPNWPRSVARKTRCLIKRKSKQTQAFAG